MIYEFPRSEAMDRWYREDNKYQFKLGKYCIIWHGLKRGIDITWMYSIFPPELLKNTYTFSPYNRIKAWMRNFLFKRKNQELKNKPYDYCDGEDYGSPNPCDMFRVSDLKKIIANSRK